MVNGDLMIRKSELAKIKSNTVPLWDEVTIRLPKCPICEESMFFSESVKGTKTYICSNTQCNQRCTVME